MRRRFEQPKGKLWKRKFPSRHSTLGLVAVFMSRAWLDRLPAECRLIGEYKRANRIARRPYLSGKSLTIVGKSPGQVATQALCSCCRQWQEPVQRTKHQNPPQTPKHIPVDVGINSPIGHFSAHNRPWRQSSHEVERWSQLCDQQSRLPRPSLGTQLALFLYQLLNLSLCPRRRRICEWRLVITSGLSRHPLSTRPTSTRARLITFTDMEPG